MKTRIALSVALCLAALAFVGCSSISNVDDAYSGRVGLNGVSKGIENGPRIYKGDMAGMTGYPDWVTVPFEAH